MNPTYCYVVEPIDEVRKTSFVNQTFQCPRSGFALQKHQSYWWSQEGAGPIRRSMALRVFVKSMEC